MTSKETVHMVGGALAGAYARRGDLRDAQRVWQRLAGQRPRDLESRFALFDLALGSGQDDARPYLRHRRTTRRAAQWYGRHAYRRLL